MFSNRYRNLIGLIASLAFLASCGTALEAVPTASTLISRYISLQQLQAHGITSEDIADLQAGKLSNIQKRYHGRAYSTLSLGQLRLSCEISIRLNEISRAQACLHSLKRRIDKPSSADKAQLLASDAEAIAGKQALLLLKSNQFEAALAISRQLTSPGGRYIYAIAAANSHQQQEANEIAEHFGKYPDPTHVFWAANIYTATKSYSKALQLLQNPAIRLNKDYALRSFKGVFGAAIEPAAFQLDVFNEYSFGIFDQFSYAPRSNVYVEYLLGTALHHTGKTTEALQSYTAILDYAYIEAFRDIHWMTLYQRGMIAQESGRATAAIDYYQKSIEVLETIRGSISAEMGRLGFVADKQDVYGRLVGLLVETGASRRAFTVSERARSRALVDLLGLRVESLSTADDGPANKRVLAEFIAQDGALAFHQNALDTAAFQSRRSAYRTARQRLTEKAPDLAALATVKPLPFETLRSLMDENESIVSYYLYQETLFVFILSKTDYVTVELPAQDIFSLVYQFRQALEDDLETVIELGLPFDQAQLYRVPARKLYQRLIEPIAQYLPHETITIVPTHTLHYLSFAALYSGDKFLVQEKTIRILPSLSVMEVLRAPDRNQRTLVIGNPLRDDESCQPNCALASAEREARRIAQISQPSTLLLGEQATENRFRQLAGNYGLLHIASHADFNEHDPLASRLLLAPSEGDNGDLTASDLYAIKLNANLVVLSACETALSKVSQGDEIIGLNRGFMFAGSSAVIGSLWQVEDTSTSELMSSLYRHMSRGDTAVNSLRQAQLETLEKYHHPYLWAAFQYVGR